MKTLFRTTVAAMALVLATADLAFAPPPVFRPAPPPNPGFRPAPVNPGVRPGVGAHPQPIHPGMPGYRPGQVNPGHFGPSPGTVQSQVGTFIQRGQPAQALRALGQEGHLLPNFARVELARKAVNELVLRVAAAKNPLTSLPEVRQARADVRNFDAHSERTLAALQARLEHQELGQTLTAVHELGQKSQWSQAGNQAQLKLQEPNLPTAVAKSFSEIARVGRQVQTLDQLHNALNTAGPNRPKETSAALSQLDAANLPASLRQGVTGLRGLAELRLIAEGRWPNGPDLPRIKQSLADFHAQAADSNLVARLQQDLAVRAFLEGFPGEARSLLPANGPPEHAANLLRDMRALVLGEGQVGTWPAERALDAGAGAPKQPTPPAPPPGLRSLIPEGEQQGWRPPVRESALAGLTPVEPGTKPTQNPAPPAGEAGRAGPAPLTDAIRLEIPWRTQLTMSIQKQTELAQQQGLLALQLVQQAQKQHQQEDEEDGKLLAEVAALLGRQLTPVERALAWQLRRQGKNAAQIAAELRQAPPRMQLDTAAAYEERGDAHLQLAEYALAIADFTDAIRLGANDELIFSKRGLVYLTQGESAKAVADFTQAVNRNPGNAMNYCDRGLAYAKMKDHDKAVIDFNEAIQLNPADPRPYRERGASYSWKKEFDKALADLNHAIALAPDDALTYVDRGDVYLHKKDYPKALADYNHALSVDPENAEAYHARGDLSMNKKDFDRALPDLDRALQLNPKSVSTYISRGDAYIWKVAYDKALADYDKAIELNPKNAAALVGRGIAFRLKRDYDRAIAEYARAIEVDPKNADAFAGRGSAYRKKGSYQNALAEYTEALKIEAKNSSAHTGIAWLFATCADEKFRDGKKALEHAQKACESITVKDFYDFEGLAAACAELGQFDDAVTWQKKALESYVPSDELEHVRQRLMLYEKRMPYREQLETQKGQGP